MKYVAMFGSVGVGKTTLGNALAEQCGDIFFAPEDLSHNRFLAPFYADMKKYAFRSAVEMLAMMAENYYMPTECSCYLLDNGVEEMICYNRCLAEIGALSPDEFALYRRLYDCILKGLPKTDLYIYCRLDEKTQMERIRRRGREYERGLDAAFIAALGEKYEEFAAALPREKIIILDMGGRIDVPALARRITGK